MRVLRAHARARTRLLARAELLGVVDGSEGVRQLGVDDDPHEQRQQHVGADRLRAADNPRA
eukprot:5438361-Prymnesium_polylepis.1